MPNVARGSRTALRSRQLRPIKSQLFAGPTHHTRVEDLTGASQGDLRRSALSMYRHDDGAVTPMLLVLIEATSSLGQPFSKCCAFQGRAPIDDAIKLYCRHSFTIYPIQSLELPLLIWVKHSRHGPTRRVSQAQGLTPLGARDFTTGTAALRTPLLMWRKACTGVLCACYPTTAGGFVGDSGRRAHRSSVVRAAIAAFVRKATVKHFTRAGSRSVIIGVER